MENDGTSALTELADRMKLYGVKVDPLAVASMLLSLAIAKGPNEMQRWFNELALDLHRARQS